MHANEVFNIKLASKKNADRNEMNETICHSTTTALTGSEVSRQYEVRAFFGILSVRILLPCHGLHDISSILYRENICFYILVIIRPQHISERYKLQA